VGFIEKERLFIYSLLIITEFRKELGYLITLQVQVLPCVRQLVAYVPYCVQIFVLSTVDYAKRESNINLRGIL
jgi:hypothetical protein